MYSTLFFRTIETVSQNSCDHKSDRPNVKLFNINISEFHELISDLFSVLSDSEQSRAHRYHFINDKNRFIICRALLKFLLAEHLGLGIGQIILEVDANKKPYLPTHSSVYFNVSHSVDYAIIAIANHPVGIDIEYINKEFDYKEILPTVFHHNEIAEIKNSRCKTFTFYKFWSRKEALLKAVGKGIDDDISKIPVTDGAHSVISSLVGDFKKINVLSFNLNDDYVGALALTADLNSCDKISFRPLPKVGQLKKLIN